MATSEADVAAKLIERLLMDPAFRVRFRRNPAEACREAGLEELAQEMSIGGGKAMMTLDMRESKSSLAGVMMAAAMEGVGVMQFVEHVAPHLDDIPEAIGDVLSRVNLPAVGGALAPSPPPSAPAAPDAAGANGVEPEADTAAAGNGAAPAAAPAAAGEPVVAPPAPDATAPAKAPPVETPAEPKTAAEQAAEKLAKAEDPKTKTAEAGQKAAEDIAEDAKDLPSATDLPDGTSAPKPEIEVGGEPKAAGEPVAAAPAAAPAAPAAPAAAPAAPAAAAPAAPAHDHAADEAAGRGDLPDTPPPATTGSVEAAAKALLENKNLVLDADAQKDIRSGDVDPRMIALLTKLTDKHKIELSVIKTGHAQFSSGGSVSNHFVGRGIDIARVDGEIVRPDSPAARELASEIAEMTGKLRPTEVGSPWPIAASGFFTDGAHQDHLHVAYDGEAPKDFEIPAAQAAPAAAAAAPPAVPAPAAPVAAAAAVPGAPPAAAAAAAPPPVPKAGESGQFLAAKADAGKKGDSGVFVAAKPAQPVAAAAAVPPPGAADAAAAAADLSGVSGAYPGDDAPKEQLAAWLGKEAEKRGLPPELPVMASLVESGVKNLNFGDADSVGFFQMRVGIWNQGEYAGFPEKPELQAKWFLDQAEAVKKQRISRGQSVDDPSQFGEWIADVERPAEQYRGRYQLRLDEAKGLLSKAAGSAPAGGAGAAVDQAAAAPAAPAAAVADVATSGASRPPDPSEYGLDGTGGKPTPEMEALLKNKNITFDATGIADIKAGKIDPRVIAAMTKLSEDHKITVTCMCSDHSRATAGGSISNHSLGRGLDIGTIDGEIVRPNSAAARELASELSQLPEEYRPNEIGSPFAISGPGYFTDAAHQDHIHFGFKQEISKDWRPPADVAAGGSAGAPAVAGAAAVPGAVPAAPGSPVAAAAAAPAPPKAGASGQFLAAKAPDPDKAASGAFMAIKPVGPASALAPPAAVPGAVDAAAAALPGSGSSTLGAAALKVAESQLGVKEAGTNTGAKVDEYLAAAKVAPGNPWCASFVTWSLEKAGRKMDGTGWAAVQTWVRNAEAGKNDLQVVSADQARPGDIVAYDWGGQEDFGSDGHIGFLKSEVKDGKFTALEGNNQDQVMNVPRQTGSANVKFIRIGGDAPPAAAPAAGAVPQPAGVADVAAAAAGGGGGSNPYPGDDAGKAQLAAWLGREAEKRGLPKQLPVMASLVESGVKNLNYGDADSVGFFQMRVGIWNKGEYAGFPEKPELQAKWFLDTAEQVKKQRIARGQSVTDPKQFGEWIADIERPAAQYRSRYGMRLGEANALLAQAGDAPAAGAVAGQAAPGAPAAAVADAAASTPGGGAGPKAMAALKEAQKYTGTAYRYGGSTPQTGFDCSGLVQWAYAKAGIQIPRVTDAQFAAGNGSKVERGDLKPGDLVFFGTPGNIYHVGISMGGDKFLHAPKTGDVVKVASLKESYFSQNFAGGRRFDDSAPVAEAAAAPGAPPIDPKAVAEAQAAVARDAAEVKRANSGLFMAVKAQEERRHKTVQFMKAIDPKEAQAAAEPVAAAPAAAAPAADAAAAPPAAVEPPAGAATPASAADAGPPIQLPEDISDDYPGNDASKDEIAKWLAKQADKHGLPPELPVMASLVESGVKNLNFGDADSVGFFQMRVGIWDQGAYKGFPKHPELQAKWFIDQALAVKKQAIARGDADFGKDPSKWGEWIADIERPAEQYRGRYQLRLKEARGLLG